MNKFTKLFLTFALLFGVMGGVNSYAKTLSVDLSKLPESSENTTWVWNAGTSTGTFTWTGTSWNSMELYGSGNYSAYETLNLVTTAGTVDHFRIIVKFTNGTGQLTIKPVNVGTQSITLLNYMTLADLANIETIRLSGADDATGNITVSSIYLEGPDAPFVSIVGSGFGDEITSFDDIADGTRFVIGDGTNAMYWVTSSVDNQKVAVENVPNDSYYYFVLENVAGLDLDGDDVEDTDNYKIKIVNASGAAFTHAWNWGHYLNYSQYGHLFAASAKAKEKDDDKDYGWDGDYYAIWKVAYSDGNGFTLKNAGINKYATVAGSSDAVTYLKFYKSIGFTSKTMYPADDEIFALSKATGYNAATGVMTNGTWTFDTPVDLSNWKYIIIAMENGCADDSREITITDNSGTTVTGEDYVGTDAGTGPNMWFSRWNHQNIGCFSLDYLKNTKSLDIEQIKSLSIAGTTKPFVVYLSCYDNSKLLSTNRWYLYKGGDLVRTYEKADVGKYGTICLPYKASCAGAEVYSIASKDASGIILTKVNGLLEAGKPYFYKASDNIGQDNAGTVCNVNFFRADFDEYDSAKPITSNGLVGTFSSMTAPAGSNYWILSGNKLYDTEGCTGDDAVTVGANKAYINTNNIASVSSARDAFISFDETTGINTVQENVMAKQTGIYNLNGQRLSQLKKGLNIINGKKVMVK